MFAQKDLLSIRQDLSNGNAELLQTPKELDRRLNRLEDGLDDPFKISEHFEQIKEIVSAFNKVSPANQIKVLTVLSNGLQKLSNFVQVSLKSKSSDSDLPRTCKVYCYLLYACAIFAEADENRKRLEWSHVKIQISETCNLLLSLPIDRLFEVRADAEALVSCMVKMLHLFVECPESMRFSNLRDQVMESLANAVQHQAYLFGIV